MYIVDAQIHIWGANTPERPWPARYAAHRPQPLLVPEVLREMDAAGVSRAVLVPPSWEGEYNDLVLAAIKQHPGRFAAMGRIDPAAPGAYEAIVAWRRQPGMLGLRFNLCWPPLSEELAQGRLGRLWEAAEKGGVPLMLLVPQSEMHHVVPVAQRYPRLKLVLDHLGLTGHVKDEEAFRHFDNLLPLAKCPNVAVKASALPYYTADRYPFSRVHSYLRRVYDAFGPRRMFWGTDLSRLPCTYRQAITMFTEEIPWLTAQDKEWIMGRGVCEWLDWKLPAGNQ